MKKQSMSLVWLVLIAVVIAWGWREIHASAKRHQPNSKALFTTETLYYKSRIDLFKASPADVDVVMLGDSITAGMEWAEYLPKIRVANRGIAADSTRGVLTRLDSVISVKPEVVYVMIGINDINLYEFEIAETIGNYQKIINLLSASGVRIVVQSTLYMQAPQNAIKKEKVAKLNNFLAGYCKRPSCNYFDLNSVLAPNGDLSESVTDDGLHLNMSGYQLWISALQRQLN